MQLDLVSPAFLLSAPGIGQKTVSRVIRYLVEQGVSWEQFWSEQQRHVDKIPLSEKQTEQLLLYQKEHTFASFSELLEKEDIRVVTESCDEYPPLLKQHQLSVPVLFAKGAVAQWHDHTPIAVVGTRHQTPYGQAVTEQLVTELVLADCQIISGAMYGVDCTAHQAALAAGGRTVGILGYGFNYWCPRSFAKKYQEMLSAGMTFFSPFAPTVQPTAGNFPARNQIVAAASAAVLVTEAGLKSGSHITASFAADLGIPVGAVPGPITNPYCEGTKELVREGAVLVTTAQDLLTELKPSS